MADHKTSDSATDPSARKDAARSTERSDSEGDLNNPVQIEQDNRVDKARAEARTGGEGPAKPEGGLNQDG